MINRQCYVMPMPFVLGICLATGSADPKPAKPDVNLPYQSERANPVVYDVDFSVVVTPPYKCNLLKVWLPIPQTDRGQDVESLEISSFPIEVKPKLETEATFGNKFAYFEFAKPEGAQIVRHRFKIKVWELRWNIDPAKVTRVMEWPEAFQPYLRSESRVVVNDRLKMVLGEIVAKSENPAKDLADVFTWVNKTIKYDHNIASLEASSEHALDKKSGHCSDYHGLCAAMGRALGYPTRVTYGINPFPKNSPSHCKLEAYIPPYGWVSFDVSETQKLIAEIEKDGALDQAKKKRLIEAAQQRLFRGFRDSTWFLQTRGTDYDLAPPAKKKAALVRTIYAEADGVALPEPDPANTEKREFAWMTVHKYVADKAVAYPFNDWKTLEPKQPD